MHHSPVKIAGLGGPVIDILIRVDDALLAAHVRGEKGGMNKIGGAEQIVMQNPQFRFVVACLAVSAACLIAAGLINLKKSTALEAHIGALNNESV